MTRAVNACVILLVAAGAADSMSTDRSGSPRTQPERHVASDAQVREEGVLLEDQGDAAPLRGHDLRAVRDLTVIDHDAPRVEGLEAGHET